MAATKPRTGIIIAVILAGVAVITSYHLISNHRISAMIGKGGIIPITGVVVDAHGQRVAGAIVCIPPGTGDEAKTDAQGRFEFKLPAKWALEVEPDKESAISRGQFTQSYIFVRDPAHNLAGIIALGKVTLKKTIALAPALILRGQVVDERGVGVKGAKMAFSLNPADNCCDAYFGEDTALTDDQGKYEIRAMPFLPGGYYSVHVRWKSGGKNGVDWAGRINMAGTGEIEVKDSHSDAHWPVHQDESGQVELNGIVVKKDAGVALFR